MQLYNRTSQSDSRLNYQIAKAARQDSYDMRAIALLTIFFLPGTFVAVSGPLLYYPCRIWGKLTVDVD